MAGAVRGDFASDGGAEGVAEKLVTVAGELEGSLAVLVNNAGLVEASPLLSDRDDSFERMMRVNLRAPWVLTRRLAPVMGGSGTGAAS